MTENQDYKTDLIALTHPFILLSIFILIINDHILKVYARSILTGKISDFAGLFFFPILLSVILHFVLKSFQFQSRNIALVSFVFTAFWFSLIKTIPFFNNLTENIFNIRIILDQSDLMALIMLPLAWKLRKKVESESKTGISKLSYVVLGIASLATMATSIAPLPTIYNLIVYENTVYADFHYKEYFFYSIDGGITWKEVDFEIPAEVSNQKRIFPKLPVILCLPENQNICYRTGDEVILESVDGGQTWITSWSVPEWRRNYLSHVSSRFDLGTLDIVQLNLDGEQIIIVSAGTEGVLVKTGNGEWESVRVGDAGPINFSAKSFYEARRSTSWEFYLLIILIIIFLYINTIVNVQNQKTLGYKLFLILPFLIGAVVILMPYLIGNDFWFLILIVLISGTFLTTLLQFFINTNKKAKMNLIFIIFVALISYGLFILWAYGVIQVYENALWFTLILNILLLVWIVYEPIKEAFQIKHKADE